MEDSILSFLGEGGKLILSISCSAIISPYDITLNSPPKTPQRISQENHKKNLFFFIESKQTVKSSSSSNSTHYLVLTNQGKYLLTHISTHPSPSTLNLNFFQTPYTHKFNINLTSPSSVQL